MPNTVEARKDAAFETGLTALGSGGFRLFFIDQQEIGAWMRAAAAHNFAASVVDVVDQFLRGLERQRSARSMALCCTCDVRFGRGALPPIVGLILPDIAVPEKAVGFGFCRACVKRASWPGPGWRQRLAEAATPLFRKIWPDFRVEGGFLEIDLDTGFPRPAGHA